MADSCTKEGAFRLLEIIQANYPYPGAKFWVECGIYGVYVIRSDTIRGLPQDEKTGQFNGSLRKST